MSSGMQLVRRQARTKGSAALVALAGTAMLFWFTSWFWALPGLALTMWLTYRWFAHRAEWGLRF